MSVSHSIDFVSIARGALAAFFLATLPAVASAQQSGPAAPDSVGASDLISATQRGVTAIVKAARESRDPRLEPDSADAKPFWQSVKRLNESADKAERGLYLKDETFHGAVGDASSAAAELDVTFSMTGSDAAGVKEAIQKTTAAVDLLVKNYSKEAARLKQGGPLTAEESQKLADIKAKQTELQKKLDELEGKVGNNKQLIDGIKKTREKSQQVSNANNDSGGFVAALLAMNLISGWMWGWHWWWGPFGFWGPPMIFDFYGFYHETIIVIDYDWDLADTYIDTGDLDYDFDFDVDDAELDLSDEFLEDHSFDLEGDDYVELAEDGAGLDIEYDLSGQLGSDFVETMDMEPEVDAYDMDGYDLEPSALESLDSGFDIDAGAMDMDMDMGGFD